jgi:hypothetical protein
MIEKDRLFIVLDESGNLHKNDKCKYFIIGGYITDNSLKGRSLFKKEISKVIERKKLKKNIEIKGSSLTNEEKEEIISNIWRSYSKNAIFYPILIVIDKENLKKEITEVNILYNFFIKILLQKLKDNKKIINQKIILKLDNKTIKVGSVNTLEEYLKAEFFFEDFTIEDVMYIDSSKKEEIQLADFICNINWRKFEYGKKKKREKFCRNMFIAYFPYYSFGQSRRKNLTRKIK